MYIQGPAGKLRLFITIFKIAEKWIQKQKNFLNFYFWNLQNLFHLFIQCGHPLLQ